MIAAVMLTPLELPGDVARAAAIEAQLIRRLLAPRAETSILEWAETHRQMADAEGGGPWRVDRVPYLRTPLLALSHPRTREVAIKKSAQSGATAGVLLNWLLHSVHLDPCNVLLLYPTEGEAEKFSKKKFTPAYRATPIVAELISDPRSRQGDNTILEKSFPGGSLGIIGGSSGRGLRMVDARKYGADDIDALDAAVDEGDQVELLRGRAQAQDGSQGLFVSSPGDARTSRITALYEEADRRGRFHVPCPHCGAMQVLRFGTPSSPFGLKWEKELRADGTMLHKPETAYYVCEANACVIDESAKYRMVQAGEYLTDAGEKVFDPTNYRAESYGFWYSAFVVLFRKVSWPNIVARFLRAKDDPNKLRVIVNTLFAETFNDEVETVEPKTLEARAQRYVGADGARIEVPDGVGILVAFADVQHDRIELLIRGFGEREVSWQILHHRIHGDTSQSEVFQTLDGWLAREYRHANGLPLRIRALGIDSGDGSRTTQVYDYVRRRQLNGVWATKGSSDPRMKEPVRIPARKSKRTGVRLVIVNTIAMKRTLFWRLSREAVAGEALPHGYMHMRAPESGWHNGSDAEYFAQLGREKARPRKDKRGRTIIDYHKTGANEAVDLEAGCIAMFRVLEELHPGLGEKLAELAAFARRAPASSVVPPRRRGARVLHSIHGD